MTPSTYEDLRLPIKAKKISIQRLSKNCYAFTAEGDPNTGVIVGDDSVMVIDAQATPLLAAKSSAASAR